jgi:lysyl-tRNA synthetase class 2
MSTDTDSSARALLYERALVARTLRSSLDERGSLQVDTPVLEPAGCTEAGQPLRTWSHSFGALRLRLVAEPYLKLLIAGGIDSVYDLARSFRDEPADAAHNLEYSLLEVYEARSTSSDMAELARVLITAAARAVNGTTTIGGPDSDQLDVASQWRKRRLHDAITEVVAEDVSVDTPLRVLRRLAERHGIVVSEPQTADRLVIGLYEQLIEPRTVGPVLYTGFPSSLAPQARPQEDDSRLAQQWDLVIFGREIATGATEATDQRQHGQSTPVHHALASAYRSGLPPCAGLAIGLERLVMTLVGATTLREVVPFPTPLSSGPPARPIKRGAT